MTEYYTKSKIQGKDQTHCGKNDLQDEHANLCFAVRHLFLAFTKYSTR